jgi:hypothetical protein
VQHGLRTTSIERKTRSKQQGSTRTVSFFLTPAFGFHTTMHPTPHRKANNYATRRKRGMANTKSQKINSERDERRRKKEKRE